MTDEALKDLEEECEVLGLKVTREVDTDGDLFGFTDYRGRTCPRWARGLAEANAFVSGYSWGVGAG